MFYHLGIPRGIYRDVSIGLFTELFTVDHILPMFLREKVSYLDGTWCVAEFKFLWSLLEVLGRYV